MAAAVGWVLLLSEYFCTALLTSDQLHGRGEALIGFGLWCLFLWWPVSYTHLTLPTKA